MDIKTKYNINDTVFLIERDLPMQWVVCPACEGDGRVTLKDNKSRLCPDCYGRGGSSQHTKDYKWVVKRSLTIGQIRAEVTNFVKGDMFDNIGGFAGKGKSTQKNTYMAYETGVGTGTVWPEDRLFPTEEEAQAECEARNTEGGK